MNGKISAASDVKLKTTAMKKHLSSSLCIITAMSIALAGCTNSVKKKLIGNWHAKNGGGVLKITAKSFTMDDDSLAEDYFVRGDTIYTSFEGNLPYTTFAIKKLDEHQLELMGPDSTAMEYSK